MYTVSPGRMISKELGEAMKKSPTDMMIFKVMSGPCPDQELLLEDGMYWLGRDTTCDIRVQDPEIAEKHARFVLKNGEIELGCSGHPVQIGSRAVSGDGARVLPYQILSAGKTRFYFAVKTPAIHAHQGRDESGGLDAQNAENLYSQWDKEWNRIKSNGPEGKFIEQSIGFETGSARIPAGNKDTVVSVEKMTSPMAKPKYGCGAFTRRFALAGLGIVVLAAILLTGYRQGMATSRVDYASPDQAVLQIAGQMGLNDISVSMNEKSHPVISGFVKTRTQHDSLLDALKENNVESVIDEVQAGDQLSESVENVLHQLGYDALGAKYSGGGKLALEGYIGEQSELSDLIHILQRDFSSVSEFDVGKVQTFEDRLDILTRYLAEDGLDGKLDAGKSNGEITITGVLDKHDKMQWRRIFRRFQREFPEMPQLVDEVKLQKEGEIAEVVVTGTIVTSYDRYVFTADGSSYREGDTMEDGAVIKTIAVDKVVVMRHDDEVVYPFRF